MDPLLDKPCSILFEKLPLIIVMKLCLKIIHIIFISKRDQILDCELNE